MATKVVTEEAQVRRGIAVAPPLESGDRLTHARD